LAWYLRKTNPKLEHDMRLSREWATPLTIGVFAIISVTGILMFFHLNTGLNKVVHEWAGLVMIGGVALHVAVNWRPFLHYFFSGVLGRSIIGLGVIVLALSFLPLGGSRGGASPPVLAMDAITKAPIAAVAPLTGKTVTQVMEDLAKAGITLASADASIDSVAGGNRAVLGRAMGVLFRKNGD
jgi:hypothetical protein